MNSPSSAVLPDILDQFPPPMRRIFLLSLGQGVPLDRVAQRLGVSLHTVTYHLRQGVISCRALGGTGSVDGEACIAAARTGEGCPAIAGERVCVPDALFAQAAGWLVRFHSGPMPQGVRQVFDDWQGQSARHAAAWTEACAVWDALEEPARTLLCEETSEAVRRQQDRRRRRWMWALALSSAALVLCVMARVPALLTPGATEFSPLGLDHVQTVVGHIVVE